MLPSCPSHQDGDVLPSPSPNIGLPQPGQIHWVCRWTWLWKANTHTCASLPGSLVVANILSCTGPFAGKDCSLKDTSQHRYTPRSNNRGNHSTSPKTSFASLVPTEHFLLICKTNAVFYVFFMINFYQISFSSLLFLRWH